VTAAAQATATGPAGAGARAASDAPRDWEAIRASSDIQFAPLPPMEPPQVPDWLAALGRFLQGMFGPVGEWLGVGWPTVEKGLIALAVLLVLVLRRLRRRAAEPQATWAPDRDEALALLEDADALAAAGRFDEATHLLLRRSVGQIGEARSDWVRPASTARELGSLAALPAAARAAFAVIAARVERSRFALRPLTEADWQTAREAYARFARIEIAG
jgi:hypothetical protein